MTQTYTVETKGFLGPLDLLLDLIEKKKLSVNEVSLKEVADGYIEYLKKLESLPIAETAHFLLVASALLLLKSVSLLPTLSLSEEEEASIDELERRLRDYKEIKRLSEYVHQLYGEKGTKKIFFGKSIYEPEPFFSPDTKTNIADLSKILRECLRTLPIQEKTPEATIVKVISLEDMIDRLRDRIQNALSMSFKQFSGHKGGPLNKEEKLTVVISFLAILELIKQEVVHATQETAYTDIQLNRHTLSS